MLGNMGSVGFVSMSSARLLKHSHTHRAEQRLPSVSSMDISKEHYPLAKDSLALLSYWHKK